MDKTMAETQRYENHEPTTRVDDAHTIDSLASLPEADDPSTALLKAIAGNYHLVIINAGSSAGSEDHTANLIDELGEILVLLIG